MTAQNWAWWDWLFNLKAELEAADRGVANVAHEGGLDVPDFAQAFKDQHQRAQELRAENRK